MARRDTRGDGRRRRSNSSGRGSSDLATRPDSRVLFTTFKRLLVWTGGIVTAVATTFAVGLATGAVNKIPLLRNAGYSSESSLLKKAGLRAKKELRIGVTDGLPGVGIRDAQTGQFSGFDIDIGYLVAADLGFARDKVHFYVVESEDRARMQAPTTNGEYVRLDLVVAAFSVTEDREAREDVSFSAPYLITEQSVITRKGHKPIERLEDLAGSKVCSLATATSMRAATEAGAPPVGGVQIPRCIDGVLDGTFDAVTLDAAILAGFVAMHPQKLQQHDIGLDVNEEWGINTGGNEALRTLVNLSLYNSATKSRDQRWEQAYNRHLRPAQVSSSPQQVAVAVQPVPVKPSVRAD